MAASLLQLGHYWVYFQVQTAQEHPWLSCGARCSERQRQRAIVNNTPFFKGTPKSQYPKADLQSCQWRWCKNDLLVSGGAPQPAEYIQTLMQHSFSTLVQEIRASHTLSQSLWILQTIKPKLDLFNVIPGALEPTTLYKQPASIQPYWVQVTLVTARLGKQDTLVHYKEPLVTMFMCRAATTELSNALEIKTQNKSSLFHTFDLSSSCLFVQALHISAFTNI